jgi:hypothetical protein
MNTDSFLENQKIRQQHFEDKLDARLVKCKNVQKYADKQNTIYDRYDNKILYGINNKMAAFGVSDGTSNQLDQLLVLDSHKLGAGAAGANPCVYENFDTENYKFTDYIIIIILVLILFIIIYNKN